MKRIIVWCLVISLVGGVVGLQPVSARVKDVPTDHWAYQAVVNLVNQGYLAVYEDGTFQGTEPVDRYTLAVTLGRILDEIQSGNGQASQDDLALLRELTTEFREELVEWYSQRDAMEEEIASARKTSEVTEERVNRVVAAQVGLQEEVEQIRADLIAEAAERNQLLEEQQTAVSENQAQIGKQQAQIEDQRLQIEEQQAKAAMQDSELQEQLAQIKQLQDALISLEDHLRSQTGSLDSLENWAGEKGAVFATLQAEDVRLQQEIDELEARIEAALNDELNALAKGTEAEIADLQKQLEELVASSAKNDGQFLRDIEHNRTNLQELSSYSEELAKDIQNLAIRLQRDNETRDDNSKQLQQEIIQLKEELKILESQLGISEEELAELNRKISDEIAVEMNATLIREQRLERQLKELQEDFDSFKSTNEQQTKSLKSQSTIAMVVAAVGIIVGFISGK